MLSSQANPINRRLLSNNLGTSYVNDLPPPNEGLAFFKVKFKTEFTLANLFDLTEYDPYGFSDYLGAYINYSYSDWLYSKSFDGIDLAAYGIVYEAGLNEITNPITGTSVPQGELVILDIFNFTYDIKNLLWGVDYSTSPASKLDADPYVAGFSYPILVQAFPTNFQKTIKNNNRAFHKYYQQ